MKEQLYLQAFINVNKKAIKNHNYAHDDIKKLVFYGIKYVNTQRVDEIHTMNDFVMAISYFIGYLTPNELINIFPITKEYDGHKYECKDYFYTMEYLNTFEKDKRIKDQDIDDGSVIGFLWEYHNWEVRRFTVALTTALERIQTAQGLPTMFDELGLETHALYESNGKQFLLDSNSKTVAIQKPMPRYLKLIK